MVRLNELICSVSGNKKQFLFYFYLLDLKVKMKHLINYLQLFNKKIVNHIQNTSDMNLKTKMVHYRRDLDALG